MVWGAICGEHRSPLIRIAGNLTGQRYRDEILDPVAIPFVQEQPRGVLFQHDNARPHTACIVQNFLAVNNVDVLSWSSRSPDVSPIDYAIARLHCSLADK